MLAVRLSYPIRTPGAGNLASADIVEALTGIPTKHVPLGTQPSLLAAGSILRWACAKSHIWGSGLRRAQMDGASPTAVNVHGLRGKLTYQALKASDTRLPDIPLGDPLFLVPRLLKIARNAAGEGKVGFACSFAERGHPAAQRLLRCPEVADLGLETLPVPFVQGAAQCDAVISTSLAGLIVAEALGIPNLWIGIDTAEDGSFEFDDWFSTMGERQEKQYRLTESDAVSALAERCALHAPEIDVQALIEAFPKNRMAEFCEDVGPGFVPLSECRRRPTPVFFISFNRGAMLRQCIDSVRALTRPVDVIVHDNGSTDASTLAELERLSVAGARVVRAKPIATPEELDGVDSTVSAYFSNWSEPVQYAVSDCDIDMSIADPCALDVYGELLNKYEAIECVGPMLRIQDVPPDYPLFNRLMNRHIRQFWRKKPRIEPLSSGQVALIEAPIDTSMALHRAGEPFRRLKRGIRVYEPFEARHLDWYPAQPGEKSYRATSSGNISHWNNRKEFERHKNAKLRFERYFYVRKNASGSLEICARSIRDQLAPDGSGRAEISPGGESRS